MTVLALILQTPPTYGIIDSLRDATPLTWAVLLVLLGFSLVSWWIIFWKAKQFREVRKQGDRFLAQIEKAQRLEDAYKAILALPDSPYGRVFRQGVNFFSELRPGSLRQGAPVAEGLSLTQLEVLRMVLDKAEAEERDVLEEAVSLAAHLAEQARLPEDDPPAQEREHRERDQHDPRGDRRVAEQAQHGGARGRLLEQQRGHRRRRHRPLARSGSRRSSLRSA